MKIFDRLKSKLTVGRVTIGGVTTILMFPLTHTRIHGGVWWRGDVLLRPIVRRRLSRNKSAEITDCIIRF